MEIAGRPHLTRLRCLTVLAVAVFATVASAQQLPELSAPVNDFANVISSEHERQIDALIRKLQAASGDVLVVATVKTFQPSADIQSYATELFENHGKGIGQKGKDNGLLLLLAVDDRAVWAEVGYDLEGIITDGFAGQTSRETMVPFFRQGDYGGGMLAGATIFAQRIAQERNVTLDGVPMVQPAPSGRQGEFPIVFVIFLVLLIFNGIRGLFGRATGGRRRRRWGSSIGPFGAGYGGWHSGGGSWGGGGGFGGGFGGFGGGRSGGGGGGASW